MAAVSVRKKKSFARSSKPMVRMCVLDHKEHMSMMSPEPVWPIPMRAIGAQNLLTMPGGVSTSGYLHKKGGSQFSLMKWPLRFIIIHKGCVYYFKSSTSAYPQGAFSLNGYNRVMRAAEETTSSNVFPFKIVHFSKKHRTWMFSAASEEERRSWMKHLRREIDHYNDRQECHTPSSDTDSDADSFYGSIEKPMDIRHLADNPDHDYMEEDDDEEEEDYLRPDSSPPHSGRPTGPPPSYPPPPVPALSNKLLQHSKAPPPPPPIHRIPTSSSFPKKLPPSPIPAPPAHRGPPASTILAHKGPPPDPPCASSQQRHAPFSPVTPPLPPPNPRRTPSKPATQQPLAALSICEQLESQLRLNHAQRNSSAHSPTHTLSPSPTHTRSHSPTPTLSHSPALSPTHTRSHSPAHSSSLGNNCKVQQAAKPGLTQTGFRPKPPPPTCKPPVPSSRKPTSTGPLVRASPEGQSFRVSADEIPAEIRSRWNSAKHDGDRSDDDDDYENVQLPDSVFIDSTETSFVEKLFRENGDCPDGLYAIRNSGTKTSKVLVVWDISISKARNYRLFEENGCVFLDRELTFPSLAILIEHYYSHPLPQHGSLCLQQPYAKTS